MRAVLLPLQLVGLTIEPDCQFEELPPVPFVFYHACEPSTSLRMLAKILHLTHIGAIHLDQARSQRAAFRLSLAVTVVFAQRVEVSGPCIGTGYFR